MEYASSPVEQPVTQILTGVSGGRPFKTSGKTLVFKASKVSGSRKKLVTLISRSSYKAVTSPGLPCRNLM